jgi:aldehyde dehydrogenase (NAD+)/betaine-aldehyde dehydrogenase
MVDRPSGVWHRMPHTALLINGSDRKGLGENLRVVDPSTEELVAELPAASLAQVDEAANAARTAFETGVWSDAQLRRSVLLKFAALINDHRDALMDMLVTEIGTPINLRSAHVDSSAEFLRWFADAAVLERKRELGFNSSFTAVSTVAYRPVGVVAVITAFNYPLNIAAAKLGASLAAGCTAVLLSSPQAPLTMLMLGELVRRAGFPPGVLNILAGGPDVGRALTEHPAVAKVTFTGSVKVGRQVMMQAAAGLRSTVLELGGKAAAVMLPGVDFNKYAFSLHARYARNAGQGCGSPTRLVVEAARYEEFCEVSRKSYARLKVGDPRDPETILGPVVSSAQRERIEAAVAAAVRAGATVIAGGGRPVIARGWYMNPVLLGGVDNKSPVAREELFGPVAVVLTYRTVDEAIEIANDTDLGLKSYIFGETRECVRLAPRLRFGTVQVNGGSALRPDAPMIGYRHSGVGAERGEDGLREFLVLQHIDVPVA